MKSAYVYSSYLKTNVLMSIFEDITSGRKFEVIVGNHLLQKYSRVFYWRDSKSLEAFSKLFPAKTLLIDEDNFELIDSLIHAL
jgi:hypothetical protein